MNFKVILVLGFVVHAFGLHPVVLVPGDGGSQLRARYVKEPPHYICGFKDRWFLLWLNIYFMFPITVDCFVETVKLNLDPTTGQTSVPDFCEIDVPGFGTVDTLQYMSSIKLYKTSYYYYLITYLVSKNGYKINEDIRGAPYDFRKIPDKYNNFASQFKQLIIDTYHSNGNETVVLVGHSLGNMFILDFLHKVDSIFKSKYIKSFISISGPYGGAVDAIRTILSGNNEHIDIIKPIELRFAESTWPSTYYLMPNRNMKTDRTFVATKHGNFTIRNLDKLMNYSGIPNASIYYKFAKQDEILKPPGVTTHCIYATNIPTATYLDYRNVNFPDTQPNVIYGPGDGTVNLDSLKLCSNWANQQSQLVTTNVINNVSHLDIIRDQRTSVLVSQLINEPDSSKPNVDMYYPIL